MAALVINKHKIMHAEHLNQSIFWLITAASQCRPHTEVKAAIWVVSLKDTEKPFTSVPHHCLGFHYEQILLSS